LKGVSVALVNDKFPLVGEYCIIAYDLGQAAG
jgi:hypothetical protein